MRGSESGGSHGRRDDLVHAAERCFATAMRLVPCRYRFDAAVLVARAAVPLFRRTRAYRVQEKMGFDSPHEIALHLVVNALTRKGAQFDPVIDVKGFEEFERAYAAGRGVLVIGPHAALTLLLVRLFYDRGFDFELINVTGSTLRAVHVSPSESKGWEDNVLGADKLNDGDAVQIRFSPEGREVLWDIK